jgi:hypothetical protein
VCGTKTTGWDNGIAIRGDKILAATAVELSKKFAVVDSSIMARVGILEMGEYQRWNNLM